MEARKRRSRSEHSDVGERSRGVGPVSPSSSAPIVKTPRHPKPPEQPSQDYTPPLQSYSLLNSLLLLLLLLLPSPPPPPLSSSSPRTPPRGASPGQCSRSIYQPDWKHPSAETQQPLRLLQLEPSREFEAEAVGSRLERLHLVQHIRE